MDSILPPCQAAFQTLGFARRRPKHQQNLVKSLCRDNLPRELTQEHCEKCILLRFRQIGSDSQKTSLLSRVGFINRLPWCLLFDHRTLLVSVLIDDEALIAMKVDTVISPVHHYSFQFSTPSHASPP